MSCDFDSARFTSLIDTFDPGDHARSRVLAIYSAAIAISDKQILDQAIKTALRCDIDRQSLYEIILQSYLFLGFPRMLEAADHFDQHFLSERQSGPPEKISSDEADQWFGDGLALCRKIYGTNYQRLEVRVSSMAPEVFRWMIIEGYGKVLSRPVVDIVDRELSIVAFLIVENRQRQLHSHIKGAINAGVSPTLLRQVVDDIGSASEAGHRSSLERLKLLGVG
ncbi:MAG: carboxymuconolactone decarboxylase family protein [candidate division Zixibacteria bacterium]|nr:carboxymuconolactone decarboxylase family protein [candidate division Zixibacteria bacterium]